MLISKTPLQQPNDVMARPRDGMHARQPALSLCNRWWHAHARYSPDIRTSKIYVEVCEGPRNAHQTIILHGGVLVHGPTMLRPNLRGDARTITPKYMVKTINKASATTTTQWCGQGVNESLWLIWALSHGCSDGLVAEAQGGLPVRCCGNSNAYVHYQSNPFFEPREVIEQPLAAECC